GGAAPRGGAAGGPAAPRPRGGRVPRVPRRPAAPGWARGAAGPAGPQGLPGPQGPIGPAGPAGTFTATTCTYVTGAPVAGTASGVVTTVTCPNGQFAVGVYPTFQAWTPGTTAGVPLSHQLAHSATSTNWFPVPNSAGCVASLLATMTLCCP